jgi:hypothetical protein
MRSDSIESLGRAGSPLWVEFTRPQDRFVHRVSGACGGWSGTLAESVEGTDEEVWPASPALQQLSIEHRERVDVALLVGMSGRSHWSLSIEAAQGTGKFLFDAACRVRESPLRCGSGYRIDWGTQYEQSTDRLRWHRGGVWYELTVLEIAGSLPARLERVADGIRIEAPPPDRLPATVRWRYQLACETIS